jgi:hypothetical protein
MKLLIAMALCLWAAACAVEPAPRYLTKAADPSAAAPRLRVPDAGAGTQTYRAVEPRPWPAAAAPDASGAKP